MQVGSLIMLLLLQFLPGINHVIQGSYVQSAAVLCWSTITPPLAGILLQSRFSVVLLSMVAVFTCTIATVIAKTTSGRWVEMRQNEGEC
jgi:hypothetical protein